MKTFSFAATYHYEDSGEIEAESIDEAREVIADLAYVSSQMGMGAMGWDWIDIHELDEIADDSEDEWEDD